MATQNIKDLENNKNSLHFQEIPLLKRFLIHGRTTLKILVVGGSVSAVGLWFITYRLNKKLNKLYSKSSPHLLDRFQHLYISRRLDATLENVAKLYEEEELDVFCPHDEEVNEPRDDSSDRNDLTLMSKLHNIKTSLFARFRTDEYREGLKNKINEMKNKEMKLFPWLYSHQDEPWTLLKMVRSDNQTSWKYGIQAIATLPHSNWRDDDFWKIAQALDTKSILTISQYEDVDLRFFLPLKKVYMGIKKLNVFNKLRTLLAELPLEHTDASTKYFTEKALRMSDDASMAEEELLGFENEGSFLGGDHLEYSEAVKHLSMTPDEKKNFLCLEAILCHSKLKNNCEEFLRQPFLPLLLKIIQKEDEQMKPIIAEILANIASSYKGVPLLVQAGWVGLLVKWRVSESSSFLLQLAATRALINLHTSYFNNQTKVMAWLGKDKDEREQNRMQSLLDGVYAFDPFHNFFSNDFDADVVFVHGLLGGAAFSWRQAVPCEDAEKEATGEKLKGTCGSFSYCWPKDWLVKDLKRVRMIGVEYFTQLSDWDPRCPYEPKEERTLKARAQDLLQRLEVADIGRRPIVWVTHSMGGLLVKEILRIAALRSPTHHILTNSCGVIFYGVPHKGSPLAELGNNLFYLTFPTIEVQELSYSNQEYLNALNDFCGKLVEKGLLNTLSFAELKATNLGDYVSKLSVHIVPPNSADPGYGQFTPVDTDHMSICKPTSRESFLYSMTVAFINECLEKKRIEKTIKVASDAIAADAETDPSDLMRFWD